MKRMIDYFRGCCRMRAAGCEPERCLERLLAAGIAFWNIHKADEFSLSFTVYRADAARAQALCQRMQCDCQPIPLRSFRGDFYGLRRRWALLLGMAAVITAMIVLPAFVVALDVEGCEQVDPAQVLRVLETENIHFGTRGQSIDNEQLRNVVLRKIPELRWMAVNCSGMRAKVLVAERSKPEPVIDRRDRVTNLIACADGVITDLSVLNGQAVCKRGDAVQKGQVVISGLMDVERVILPTRALGEVYADTRREMTVLTPRDRVLRTPENIAGRCFYLCAGRKRIKICGSSGIFMGDCVKMIRRKELILPGGYPVPLALCIETYYRTVPQAAPLSETQAKTLLEGCVARSLSRELVAGTVESSQSELEVDDSLCRLTQILHCHEMIARSAEIPILELEQHGTNDQRGTDGTAD